LKILIPNVERLESSSIGAKIHPASEVGLHQVNNLVLAIDDRNNSPPVEGQTRMRDIEPDHVADSYVVFRPDLEIRMLVHQFGQDPVFGRGTGRLPARPEMQDREGKPEIEGSVPLSDSDDCP
jgi:hypothetical protein